jgi:pantothenate synthetase
VSRTARSHPQFSRQVKNGIKDQFATIKINQKENIRYQDNLKIVSRKKSVTEEEVAKELKLKTDIILDYFKEVDGRNSFCLIS